MKISLKAARVNAEMTQREAAKKINISRDSLLAWENGKTVPQFTYVKALCDLYGVSVDDIFLGKRSTLG